MLSYVLSDASVKRCKRRMGRELSYMPLSERDKRILLGACKLRWNRVFASTHLDEAVDQIQTEAQKARQISFTEGYAGAIKVKR